MDINNTELWLMVFASDTLRYLIGVGLVSLVLFGLFRNFPSRIGFNRAAPAARIFFGNFPTRY